MTIQSRENLSPLYADPLAGVPHRTKEWYEQHPQALEPKDPEVVRKNKEWRSKILAEALERGEMAWQVIARHRREQAEKEQRETQTEPQS